MYPPFEERAYLLREYDRKDGTLSLSRCTYEQYTYYPRSFQLGMNNQGISMLIIGTAIILVMFSLYFLIGLPSPSERNKCDINFNPIIETNPQMPNVWIFLLLKS